MRVQVNLRILEDAFELYETFKIGAEKSDREWLEKINNTISDIVSLSNKLLIAEIYKLHEMGLEITYP